MREFLENVSLFIQSRPNSVNREITSNNYAQALTKSEHTNIFYVA